MGQVCVSFDLDAVSLWTTTFRQASPSAISRGEYGPDVALPRILRMLDDLKVPSTFFVPGMVAELYPDAVRAIMDGGHEVGSHGDIHARHAFLDMDEERQEIERGIARLSAVTGEVPTGFRAPGWDLSQNTIALLQDLGVTYDSSQFGNDYTPYRARIGDAAGHGFWRPGEPSSVWEIPIAWELDDVPYFLINPPAFFGTTPPSTVLEIWSGELEFMAREVPEGVFTLTLHPQIIGRGPRVEVLAELLKRAEERQLSFAKIGQVVAGLQGGNEVAPADGHGR